MCFCGSIKVLSVLVLRVVFFLQSSQDWVTHATGHAAPVVPTEKVQEADTNSDSRRSSNLVSICYELDLGGVLLSLELTGSIRRAFLKFKAGNGIFMDMLQLLFFRSPNVFGYLKSPFALRSDYIA